MAYISSPAAAMSYSSAKQPSLKFTGLAANVLRINRRQNQHYTPFFYFSNPAKFQHFRCNISWENESCKLKNLQTFVWLGVCIIPPVILANVCKFLNFSTYIFSADITPEMLKLCRITKVKVFFLVQVYVFNTVEPPVSGHPRDQGEVSAYGGVRKKSCTRGHITHQNKHFKTLRPLVTVSSIKGLLDVAFLLYCAYIL